MSIPQETADIILGSVLELQSELADLAELSPTNVCDAVVGDANVALTYVRENTLAGDLEATAAAMLDAATAATALATCAANAERPDIAARWNQIAADYNAAVDELTAAQTSQTTTKWLVGGGLVVAAGALVYAVTR